MFPEKGAACGLHGSRLGIRKARRICAQVGATGRKTGETRDLCPRLLVLLSGGFRPGILDGPSCQPHPCDLPPEQATIWGSRCLISIFLGVVRWVQKSLVKVAASSDEKNVACVQRSDTARNNR